MKSFLTFTNELVSYMASSRVQLAHNGQRGRSETSSGQVS